MVGAVTWEVGEEAGAHGEDSDIPPQGNTSVVYILRSCSPPSQTTYPPTPLPPSSPSAR